MSLPKHVFSLLSLFFVLAVLVACQPIAPVNDVQSVNVAQVADLAQTTKIEIVEYSSDGDSQKEQVTLIEDKASIDMFVTSLDHSLPLVPALRCPDRFLVRFHLSSGEVHEFGYSCDDGSNLLRGVDVSAEGLAVEPPPEFGDVLNIAAQSQ